jgi:hypothetical protein
MPDIVGSIYFLMANDLARPLGQKKVIGQYGADDRETALRLLAHNGGNVQRTIAQLQSEGRAIDGSHLANWRDITHARRYAELCIEVANDVSANAAGEAMEIATEASLAEREYLAAARAKIDEVPARDLARSAQALTQVKAGQIHSARLLREQPTTITETRDLGELVEILEHANVFRDPDRKPDHIDAEVLSEE